PSLLRFWNAALREKQAASSELALAGGVPARATISPCRSVTGEPIGTALLLRDITRERQIQVELPVAVARRLVEATGIREISAAVDSLTIRERQILALLAGGLSNAAMGAKLHLSAHTIASHLKHLFPKIGVHSR